MSYQTTQLAQSSTPDARSRGWRYPVVRAPAMSSASGAVFTFRLFSSLIQAFQWLRSDMPSKTSGGTLSWDARRLIAESRSEEHTSELQSLMRISYAVFCLEKKKKQITK